MMASGVLVEDKLVAYGLLTGSHFVLH